MSHRRLFGRACAVAALLVSGAVAAAPSAHAASAVTATPSTNLVDGQSVTVAGTGFGATSTYYLVECSSLSGQSSCDTSTLKTGMTGADGSFSTAFPVKTGTIGDGKCDPGSTCYLVATTDPNTPTAASATTIMFKAPTPGAPALSATPSTGLTDGQSVTVAGSSFEASKTYYLLECSSLSGQSGCDTGTLKTGTTGADGSFSTPFSVKTGTIGNGTCDAGSTCYLVASTDPNGSAAASASTTIKFAKAASAAPVLTPTPATGLHAGQTVTLKGTNFDPSKGYFLLECANLSGQDGCDTGTLKTGTVKADGTFTTPFTVKGGTIGNGKCVGGSTCYLIATTDPNTPSAAGIAPIKFAATTATSTKAAFHKKSSTLAGRVTAAGAGVKGLRVSIERKVDGAWQVLYKVTTGADGTFTSLKINKAGTFRAETLAQGKYAGSTSKPVTVQQ